jgi:hypothetical protein
MNKVNFALLRQSATLLPYFSRFARLKTLAAKGFCYQLQVPPGPRLERWVALHVHERDLLLAHQGTYNELTEIKAERLVACVPRWGGFGFRHYLPDEDRLAESATRAELILFYHCLALAKKELQIKHPLIAAELAKIFLLRLPIKVPLLPVLDCGPWPHRLGFSEHYIDFRRAPKTEI